MSTLTFIAISAVVLTAIYSIPQAIKVYLSSSPKAISGFSVAFMLFGSIAWVLYGYSSGINAITIAYSGLFIFSLFVFIFMMQKTGVNIKRTSALCIALAGVLFATYVYLPIEALGYLGGALSALMAIPQGFKLIRQREAAGVSALSYLVLAMASICWVLYGHFTENLILVLPNLLIFPTAALVYFNVIKYRSSNFWYYKTISTPTRNTLASSK